MLPIVKIFLIYIKTKNLLLSKTKNFRLQIKNLILLFQVMFLNMSKMLVFLLKNWKELQVVGILKFRLDLKII